MNDRDPAHIAHIVQSQFNMASQESQSQKELIQQVRATAPPDVGNDQPWYRSVLNMNKPLPALPEETVFDDDKFGDFQIATTSGDDSWVPFECNDSPPPSPLPRGYLRFSQNIEPFYAPMDLCSDADDVDDLSTYESPSADYAPLLKDNSSCSISSQTRHGTPTQRMWAMGKQALAKLSTTKKAKGATLAYTGQGVVTNVETAISKHEDCSTSTVSEAVPHEEVQEEVTTLHGPKVERLPQSWIDAEREAWNS